MYTNILHNSQGQFNFKNNSKTSHYPRQCGMNLWNIEGYWLLKVLLKKIVKLKLWDKCILHSMFEDIKLFSYIGLDLTRRHTITDGYVVGLIMVCIQIRLTIKKGQHRKESLSSLKKSVMPHANQANQV